VNAFARTQRSRQCPIWLGLAALLLGFSAPAVAQSTIVYGRFPPTIVPPPATRFPMDDEGTRLFPGFAGASTYPMDLAGGLAYSFVARQASFDIYPWSSNAVIALLTSELGDSSAIPLSFGEEIGPDAQGYNWVGHTDLLGGTFGPALISCTDFGCQGFLLGLDSAYLGLQFHANGETYYGWVRVSAPFSAPSGGICGGWLYEYGYETRPNTAIKAGAKPVIVAVAVPVVVRAGFLRLSWLSETGKAYQVQSKASLDAFGWTNLNFAVPATSTNTLLDLPMSGATQFFRVVAAD